MEESLLGLTKPEMWFNTKEKFTEPCGEGKKSPDLIFALTKAPAETKAGNG